jgi:hypothetical protein
MYFVAVIYSFLSSFIPTALPNCTFKFFHIFISMRNTIWHLNHSEELKLLYESVHISHDRSSHKLLNRGRQILLNFRYVLEGRILWILVLAVLKNIESSIFYKHFIKNPKIDFFFWKKGVWMWLYLANRLADWGEIYSEHTSWCILLIIKFFSKSIAPLGLYNIWKNHPFSQFVVHINVWLKWARALKFLHKIHRSVLYQQ